VANSSKLRYTRGSEYKSENIPPPTLILYHSGVVRVKEKLTRGFKKIWGDFTQFDDPAALFEGFSHKVRGFSRPAPENSSLIFYEYRLK